jgi:hypothetical protein
MRKRAHLLSATAAGVLVHELTATIMHMQAPSGLVKSRDIGRTQNSRAADE